MSLSGHPFVRRLSRVTKVSRTDMRSLEAVVGNERLVKKRQDLVIDGARYSDLCFVKEGYGIRYRLLRNGKRQILNVILPGDIVGFPVSFFDRSIYSVVALTDMKCSICRLDSYVRLCYEIPQFGLALSWLAAHEAATYAEHIVNLGRRTPVERLAHLLLEVHARLLEVGRASKTSFDLPFSQEVIADVLGLSVEHLNRMMQRLRAGRLITSRARAIELSDMSGLRRLAQYEPRRFTRIPAPRATD
jgi:CRP-like cAMP-binding protein